MRQKSANDATLGGRIGAKLNDRSSQMESRAGTYVENTTEILCFRPVYSLF